MSNELTKMERQELATQGERPQSMLQFVMRAAAQEDLDPARLREFLAIGRELEADNARRAYNIDWEAMAPELPIVNERGVNTFTGNRYAKWDDIHKACMPVLRKFGFSVSFDSRKDGEVLFVIVVIKHRGGHEERPSFPFPWRDPSKGRSASDEVSAALSKAQRHAFRKAFNILSIGEEENVTMGQKIGEEKIASMKDILSACEDKHAGVSARFMAWLKKEFHADSLSDLRASHVADVDKELGNLQKRLGLK